MEFDMNRFGVPCHGYALTLKSGKEIIMDIGYEEDWGNVQRCFKDGADGKSEECVGWGDADEWEEVTKVFDCESGVDLTPLEWAKDDVWVWADLYAQ